MFSKKIITLFSIFFLSYFFTNYFLKEKLLLNYDSIELNANIQLFKQNDISIIHDQLNNLTFYSSVSKALTGNKLADELLYKIQKNEICNRLDAAKKRNPRIIPSTNNLEISLIFQDSNNAINCENDIKKYIVEKKNFYLKNAEMVLNHYSLKVEKLKIFLLPHIENNQKKTNAENKYLKDSYNNPSLSFIINFYDDYEFYKKNLNQIFASDFIYLNSEINSDSSFNIKIINHLYLLFLIILSLIMYRKELEIFFKKIKKKL